MNKSNILFNKEDYIEWMFGSSYWTNKSYQPTPSELPYNYQYPCIAVGEWVKDYHTGRDRPSIELVELGDFRGTKLYRLVELMDNIHQVVLGMFSSEMKANTEKSNYKDDESFKYVIREMTLDG